MTGFGQHWNDSPLIELADRAIDGTLTRADAEELDQLLQGDLAMMQLYVQYIGLHAALCDEAAGESTDLRQTLARAHAETDRRRRRQQLRQAAAALAAGVCLFLVVGYLALIWPYVVAEVVQTSSQFAWAEKPRSDSGHVRLGDQLHIASGFVDLRFHNGAALSVRGPALAHIISGTEVHLEYGQVLSRVPADAIGFTITTPDGRLVDLGTEFLVSISSGTRTTTTVRQGLIEIQGDKPADARRLATNEAAAFDPDHKGWIDAPPDLGALEAFDLKTLGFEVLSGNVSLLSNHRGPLLDRHSSGKPGIFFIPERQSIRLTSPIHLTRLDGNSMKLPAGTVVNSFLLDAIGDEQQKWACAASFSSRAPIAGFIAGAYERESADGQLGLSSLEYPTSPQAGVELDHPSKADGVSFSPDGRRIDVRFSGMRKEHDVMRLIVVVDPPAPDRRSP
jgi:hypothetical protein